LVDKSADLKIAEQSKVNPRTVKNAEKFADAVDKVSENTGINPQKILSYGEDGKIPLPSSCSKEMACLYFYLKSWHFYFSTLKDVTFLVLALKLIYRSK